MKKYLLVLVIFISLTSLSSFAQNVNEQKKIDPVFTDKNGHITQMKDFEILSKAEIVKPASYVKGHVIVKLAYYNRQPECSSWNS